VTDERKPTLAELTAEAERMIEAMVDALDAERRRYLRVLQDVAKAVRRDAPADSRIAEIALLLGTVRLDR
jgi:hypothetical protein